MKYMKFFLVICFLQLICNGLFAQELDSLITEAINNSVKLKALNCLVETASYRAEGATAMPAPSISLEFSQVPVGKLDIFNESISNNLAIAQMFPIGGKLKAMADVEKKSESTARLTLETQKLSIASQVKMVYYELWLACKDVEIKKSLILAEKELISFLYSQIAIGNYGQADLILLKSTLAVSEANLLLKNNAVRNAKTKLNTLLGRELESQSVYTLNDLPVVSVSMNQTEIVKRISELNPNILSMESMAGMNKLMIEANNKELIPDLMVQAMLMRMPQGMILTAKNSMPMYEGKDEYMFSLMASVTLPFMPWSKGKYEAKESELLSGIKSINYEKQNMINEMTASALNSLSKINALKTQILSYKNEILPSFNDAIKAQLNAFKIGKTGITSIIETEKMESMEKMNYYMAIADYNMAIANLEMSLGIIYSPLRISN